MEGRKEGRSEMGRTCKCLVYLFMALFHSDKCGIGRGEREGENERSGVK